MKNNITKHTLLTVCLLLAFSGCRDKAVPDGVVDTATLARFLTEAHIIDSYDYTVASKNRDSLQHDVNAAYDSLYSKYGITKADYDTRGDQLKRIHQRENARALYRRQHSRSQQPRLLRH